MGLQLAKAVNAVPAAEDDRSSCDVLIADGHEPRGAFVHGSGTCLLIAGVSSSAGWPDGAYRREGVITVEPSHLARNTRSSPLEHSPRLTISFALDSMPCGQRTRSL